MIQATKVRMPAEWAEHERTVMSWPTLRDVWGDCFEQAKQEYAATARAIARFEPVLMVVNPGEERDAARHCGSTVEIVSFPINDSWMRDSGPITVRSSEGEREGIHFRFNAYGGRFPFEKDASVGQRVLEKLGIACRRSELVLEGGSISVDGLGALITTEQCLLNANRNPGWNREEIERELHAQLGIDKIIWLRWGRLEDMHTDGHVDLVCMFVAPATVVAQGCDDASNANYHRLQANLRLLSSATDAQGRALKVIELPLLPLIDVGGQTVMLSNENFYFVNGGLIVPVTGDVRDEQALDVLRAACPGREVVGVPSKAIALGGGGTHCITQQIPK